LLLDDSFKLTLILKLIPYGAVSNHLLKIADLSFSGFAELNL